MHDANKCEVTYKTAIESKEFSLESKLRNGVNAFLINRSENISVIVFDKDMKYVHVKPIKGVDGGLYKTSFTVSRYGYYMIHTTVDGHHIPSSPYK